MGEFCPFLRGIMAKHTKITAKNEHFARLLIANGTIYL